MSYAVQPPVAGPPVPVAAPVPARPVTVNVATAVLLLMAVVGLGYAIATIVSAPGTVSRFRSAAAGASGVEVDGYVSVVWIGAAIGTVLAIILVALFVVLAMGLRRGSNPARIGTLVICGLGLLAGLGSALTVAGQRSGPGDPQSLGAALSGSYPVSWIGLNVGLSIAQMAGYLVVGALLLFSRGPWFGHAPKAPAHPDPYAQQTWPAASGGFGPAGPGSGTPYSYGYQPVADQGYHPAGGPQWGPGAQSVSGQGQSPAGAGTPAPGQSFGVPPMGPGQSPSGPSGAPPSGPDDEYWARPSS